MSKFIILALCLIVMTNSASAQIYLRKDNNAGAVKAQPQAAPQYRPKANNAIPQEMPQEKAPSANAADFARMIASTCLGGAWKTQPCLKAVSENNLTMASNYAAALIENGMEQSGENIKQNCAASTAATRGEYPADAMRSAYVECVNNIVTESEKTNILPDQSQFQLIVSAVQCLDGAPSCPAIEQGLSAYK